jgi:hypothetical protein
MREKKYTPSQDVFNAVVETIKTYAPLIPGCQRDLDRLGSRILGDSISVSWERSWTVGCSLGFDLRPIGRETKEDGSRVRTYGFVVDVSWSSTERSPAASRAAIALYSAVTDLAAQIETMCDSFGHIGDVEIAKDGGTNQ